MTFSKSPSDKSRRALEILRALGRSSTAKYEAMANWIGEDDRVRGGLLFHGASTGRWCLTGDHEVLTPNGWVRLDKWNGGYIAVWSDGSVEHALFEYSRLVAFPYSGSLVHLKSKRVDQLSTPEHRMPVWHGAGVVGKNAEDIARVTVPFTGFYSDVECCELANMRLRTRLMVQADGHFTRKGALRLRFKKARKVARCRELLYECGIDYREIARPDNVTEFRVVKVQLPSWLSPSCKRFDWDLLAEDADVIFDELKHWDGNKSGPTSLQYSTTVERNKDVIQALAHISGRAVSVTMRQPKEHWSPCFTVSVWLKPGLRHELRRGAIEQADDIWVYCASTPTGYFYVRRNGKVWITGNSGQGPQPQNFPKGKLKDQEAAWRALKSQNRETIAALRDSKGQPFDGPMDVLSSALRGVIIPREGYDLCVADYASIEARVLLWLAGETKALNIFRTGGDIYLDMATEIYGYECNKQDHPHERALGKIAVLGLGYQMGAGKFAATCEASGIRVDDDLAERVVHAYRSKYWRVKRLWYEMEEAACEAVSDGGKRGSGTRYNIMWQVEGRFLYATLPSGRRLAYPDPEVRLRKTPWGDVKPSLTFMGVDPHTHQWKRQTMYGGMLVENLVQAIARDILADALMRCEQGGKYIPILTVHDEIIADVASGTGNAKEFEALLADIPQWAQGCPIAAEAWIGCRYAKG